MTSESSRAGIARAPWSACPACWNICTVAKTGEEADESVNRTRQDAVGHATAGAGSASLSANVPPWCRSPPRRASRVRISSWAPSSPRYSVALVDAPLRSVCQASPCCGKRYRTAPPTCSTPSLRPRSPPSSTPPKVCLEIMEFDFRRRHGTTTTHAPHSSPKVAWNKTSTRCQIGRSGRLRLHERAARLVITGKEIRCTRCHTPK